MPQLNKVFLAGNLTRDPEVRYIPSGTAVADLGVAVTESYKNKEGALVETTCFVDVVVWGRQAEACRDYLNKGSPVLIEGRLQLDQWESQQGEKRSKLRVRADRVQFLSSPRRGAEYGDAPEGRKKGGKPADAGSSDAPPPPPPPAEGGEGQDDNLPF